MNIRGKLPTVKVELGLNRECEAVLDSGSSVSLISKALYNQLGAVKLVKNTKKLSKNLGLANGEKVVVRKEVRLHLKIGVFSWVYNFWVVNKLPVDVILGYDFFRFTKLKLDTERGEIKFDFAPGHVTLYLADSKVIEVPKPKMDDSELTSEEREAFDNLLTRYQDVITTRIGRARTQPYELKVREPVKPIRSKPFQMNPERLRAMRQIVHNLLEQGVIEPSTSEFSCNSFLVPKKDPGEWRLVCNYKPINQYIEFDSFPTPVIDTLFQYLRDARYFTSIDLNNSYYQLELSKASRKYTAFSTPFGLYQFTTVPQGIKIGSQALGRLVDEVLGDLKYRSVINYIDDILIYSPDATTHLRDVEEVLRRLRGTGLTVNPRKISLAKRGIHILAHIVQDGKLYLNSDRAAIIRGYPRPRNLKQVQRWVGMVSYYAKFIENFAEICRPLNSLKKKGVRFRWGKEQSESFEKLKEALSSPPVLHLPDYSQRFILSCDASETAIACVLEQHHNGKPVPVAYASRTLTGSELQYNVFRKEFLACLFGCEKFRPYLGDRTFTLRTDCQAITYVMNSDKTTGQLARWKLRLSEFPCEVEHCRGTQNIVADTLSRMFNENNNTQPDETKHRQTDTQGDQTFFLLQFPESFITLQTKQIEDISLGGIIEQLKRGESVEHYTLHRGILKYRRNKRCSPKVVIPDSMKTMVMKFYHDSTLSAHWGIKKTIANITKHYTWETIFKDVKRYVQTCELCQLSKPAQSKKIGLLNSTLPTHSMQRLHIDLFGPLPRSTNGNTYALVCIDPFTKFSWLFSLRKATSGTIIRVLRDRLFAQHGPPECIVSDNGSQFTSLEFKVFLFSLGIGHIRTSVARPQGNQSERLNRNLKFALKIYHSQTQQKWDEHLAYLNMALNSGVHDSTGVTPAYAHLGREFNHPLRMNWNLGEEITNEETANRVRKILENLKIARRKARDRYNQNRVPATYRVGDKVLYRRYIPSNKVKKVAHKLTPLWKGPYTVIEVINPVNIRIQLDTNPNEIRIVHVAQVKVYHARDS